MQAITIHVTDEVARNLAAEAATLRISIEELAEQRVSAPKQSSQGAPQKSGPTDYVQLARAASKAPSARKSVREIDRDVEATRNEW